MNNAGVFCKTSALFRLGNDFGKIPAVDMLDAGPLDQAPGEEAVLVALSRLLDAVGGHDDGAGEGGELLGLILPGGAVVADKMAVLLQFRVAVAGEHFAVGVNVDALAFGLLEQQIDVRTKSADIDLVKALDRNLSIVYWIIAIIVVGGFCLSFGTSLWANVNRKAREYSLLRLIGFNSAGIVWFPLIQALLTGALGWLLACMVYFIIQFSLNSLFLDNIGAGQSVCRLHPFHLLVALFLTLIAAVLAAAVGGMRVARMELSSGLKGR